MSANMLFVNLHIYELELEWHSTEHIAPPTVLFYTHL